MESVKSTGRVSDFEGARDLFNAAMSDYKRALEYYQLDGHVTQHCQINLAISSIYK